MAESKILLDKPNMVFANYDNALSELVEIEEANIDSTNRLFTAVIHNNEGKLPVNYDGYLWTFRRQQNNSGIQFFTRVTKTVGILYMRKFQSGSWGDWLSITFS